MNPELASLQKEMKRLLKQADKNYEDIAQALGVSSMTIKRALNQKDINFSRLIEICQFIGVSFYDLVSLSKEHTKQVYSLSSKQEMLLAKDKRYFLVFRSLLKGNELQDIKRTFGLTQNDLNKIIRELEGCQLLERHIHDRIKLLANFPFKWIAKGPLEKKYGPEILRRIFDHTFKIGMNQQTDGGINFVFEWGLSDETQKQFYTELSEIFEKYRSYAQLEINHLESNFTPTTGMITVGRFALWEN